MTFECKRCGLCCLTGLCDDGEYKKDPICKELVIYKDLTTSCKLIQRGKGEKYLLGGCVLQEMEDSYAKYEKQFKEIKWKEMLRQSI